MKILRYLDPHGLASFAEQTENGEVHHLEGSMESGFIQTGEKVRETAQILAPIAPSVIYGIGLNYHAHAAETGSKPPVRPIVFLKSPSSVQGPDAPILLPRAMASQEVDYECELAIVIGRTCKNATADSALNYVLGYTAANDVSARDWQLRLGGSQWCRGKTFDTFCPLGPVLVTPDEIGDPDNLALRTYLNGEVVQQSNTADMIFSVAELIAFLSGSTTLLPGTVILTGTPEGVGMAAEPPRWLRVGDEVVIEIEGIGRLRNWAEEERL